MKQIDRIELWASWLMGELSEQHTHTLIPIEYVHCGRDTHLTRHTAAALSRRVWRCDKICCLFSARAHTLGMRPFAGKFAHIRPRICTCSTCRVGCMLACWLAKRAHTLHTVLATHTHTHYGLYRIIIQSAFMRSPPGYGTNTIMHPIRCRPTVRPTDRPSAPQKQPQCTPTHIIYISDRSAAIALQPSQHRSRCRHRRRRRRRRIRFGNIILIMRRMHRHTQP